VLQLLHQVLDLRRTRRGVGRILTRPYGGGRRGIGGLLLRGGGAIGTFERIETRAPLGELAADGFHFTCPRREIGALRTRGGGLGARRTRHSAAGGYCRGRRVAPRRSGNLAAREDAVAGHRRRPEGPDAVGGAQYLSIVHRHLARPNGDDLRRGHLAADNDGLPGLGRLLGRSRLLLRRRLRQARDERGRGHRRDPNDESSAHHGVPPVFAGAGAGASIAGDSSTVPPNADLARSTHGFAILSCVALSTNVCQVFRASLKY